MKQRREPGTTWGYSERPDDLTCPLVQAEIIAAASKFAHRVTVRWLDGADAGQEAVVAKKNLVVPWDQADAWMLDNSRLAAVRAAGPSEAEQPELGAASFVMHVYPDKFVMSLDEWGALTSTVPLLLMYELALEETDLYQDSLAYLDSAGVYHAPWSTTKRIMQRLCTIFAPEILRDAADYEAVVLDALAATSDQTPIIGVLGQQPILIANKEEMRSPVFDVVREWCGAEETARFNEMEAILDENDYFRDLIVSVIHDLETGQRKTSVAELREAVGLPPRQKKRVLKNLPM